VDKCAFDGCAKPIFHAIRIRLQHPMRRTWVTARFCKGHYFIFIKENGKGWFRHYKNKGYKAPVIEFEVLE
jgi:hypothetical protein